MNFLSLTLIFILFAICSLHSPLLCFNPQSKFQATKHIDIVVEVKECLENNKTFHQIVLLQGIVFIPRSKRLSMNVVPSVRNDKIILITKQNTDLPTASTKYWIKTSWMWHYFDSAVPTLFVLLSSMARIERSKGSVMNGLKVTELMFLFHKPYISILRLLSMTLPCVRHWNFGSVVLNLFMRF